MLTTDSKEASYKAPLTRNVRLHKCDTVVMQVCIIESRFGKKNSLKVDLKNILVYPTSSRDEIQTDFADNVFFQIKPRHSTQDDE